MSDERARLFVALELPGDLRAELARWSQHATQGLPGVRALAPELLHVTLCFLGSQPVQELQQIAAACNVIDSEPRVELAVAAPVWLPSRRPRVLAVGLEDPIEAVGRIQHKLSRALVSGGWYRQEERPFLPHVTVGRVATGARTGRPVLAAPPTRRFEGSAATLYRSRLGPGGPRYEPLSTIELGAPISGG